ncbi:hypothetical protein A2276_04790 [candidate division WOR-1 bacterium RIFOXYA12_FULL_43_27]|uniref:FAD/NAD(P)-binding domain-containing protein n=1 Tax=candidate division WOR-1 bacterium RIFOXYC2_FULL_46_14 TaxID=1802587 RepID=A0A1F4U332_UNCSA|nr:MAG: hypothetical protein A2276_04790 [candidate division WOR-1 bacterium RIFOXYA12_FULL_43_27]OGC18947.1 MAG: hypothetical protein A2292_08045 [candidate division WOR-1 bacterium RIFOXYB2_FULL_46_45]OGC29089.1 MAG: hypothetical protein A2232_03110 [candidate division WOR-1 bacterium RIFOXYA2_FULL_46_56]OGC39291.1 MAG: hypothetical protein A2438_07010 [candidate division WOR-1 bacterium RIFOXYC2_FULL_46_14]
MLDLIIIGAGPAGITAAIYAARKKIEFLIISRDVGGQAAWAGEIENYTGQQLVTGPELAIKFREHLEKYKFELKEGVGVSKIEKIDGGFSVATEKDETFSAKTIIVASGKRPRLLNIPGESKYKNKGLFYCATCDGPLFAGKKVAVIGGGNSALDAAMSLMKIASKVYMVNNGPEFTGDLVMIEKVKRSPNVEFINNAKTVCVTGDQFVKGLTVEVSGVKKEIELEGVFVQIGLVPNSSMIGFVEKNEAGEIKVNNACQSSDPALFAAGDVTDVADKQIIIAAGEGSKAALSAFKYLSTH